ncbi:prepilin-type N-terminal cleavage/methylation domain-containing protein [Snodgrassella sp. ESL0304]|uniref:PilW family protein n=1 Tax=Snodgrassella sp. ESL0304 TaxID=2705032 RepID=UPI0015813C9E|nr:prepilin-type N-terminal cleavage/methylation domain-containing protein [Snodgrassella sp. ESL0304]NUE80629.1 prepilin-type N-terminal cleavage/methylation domain-containing protein [Snodgrassella sp. ESL0304]
MNTTDKNTKIDPIMKIVKITKLKQIPRRQHGFSLVELMVATAISIIVLMAASSTFLTTYKLKEQVKTRISYEQDVRNAANVIRSDMRQLADFSCMNPPSTSQLNSIFENAFSGKNKQFLSTELPTASSSIAVEPVTGSRPLVLTYISDKLANSILSSQCQTNIDDKDISGAVYVVGTTQFDRDPGFYRVSYSNKTFSAPQLIVRNVTAVNYHFDYDDHTANDCPSEASAASNTPSPPLDANITSTTDLDFKYEKPPVLIGVTLTVRPNGTNDNTTINYEINASVRQGEVCVSSKI